MVAVKVVVGMGACDRKPVTLVGHGAELSSPTSGSVFHHFKIFNVLNLITTDYNRSHE